MGNMQCFRSLFISEADVTASPSVSAEQGGLLTHKISKTITYHYRRDPGTPAPPNPSRSSDGVDGRRRADAPASPPRGPASPPPSPRTLVLLLPWLGAGRQALAKYRDLYLERGMDVLTVESGVLHFLWPRWGLAYGLDALRALEAPWLRGRPVVVHTCSIGGYTFSMMLCHLARGPERHGRLTQRIKGQIHDSLVAGSLEHMATGLGKSLFPRLEGVVKSAAMLFFWLFKRHTADYYEGALHVFRHNPVRAPALFFYCDDDAMCDAAVMETTMDLWRGRGVAVDHRRWARSVHAAHLRCHRDEYLAALESFLSAPSVAPR